MTGIACYNFNGADVRTMTSREIAELTGKRHDHEARTRRHAVVC